METIIFVGLGLFAMWVIGLTCHQYFFRDSFQYDDDDEEDSNEQSSTVGSTDAAR